MTSETLSSQDRFHCFHFPEERECGISISKYVMVVVSFMNNRLSETNHELQN